MPDTISCEPTDLAQASKCFCFGDQRQVDSVMIYLLTQIAGDTSTPAELARKSACYCYDAKSSEAVKLFLLCSISDALGA